MADDSDSVETLLRHLISLVDNLERQVRGLKDETDSGFGRLRSQITEVQEELQSDILVTFRKVKELAGE